MARVRLEPGLQRRAVLFGTGLVMDAHAPFHGLLGQDVILLAGGNRGWNGHGC